MDKFLLWIFVFVLCIGFVSSVMVENADFMISCSPDDVPVNSLGYVSSCEYVNKLSKVVSVDLAICFDSVIDKMSFRDVKSNVKSVSKKVKDKDNFKNCEYYDKVSLSPFERKVVSINFVPLNWDKPKWDTYIIDSKSKIKLLALDPSFNASHYELGTNRSSSYSWTFNGANNNDISSLSSNINQTVLTSRFLNQFVLNLSIDDTTDLLSPLSSIRDGDTSSAASYSSYQSSYVLRSFSSSTFVNKVRYRFDRVSNVGAGYTEYVYFRITNSSGSFNLQTFNYSNSGINNQDYETILVINQSINSFGLYSTMSGGSSSGQFRVYELSTFINESEKPNSILTSSVINLSMFVSKFRINTSFSGAGYVNVSFDNNLSNAVKVNLSNSSWITPSTSFNVNNRLRYVLFLQGNETIINSFILDFNASITNISSTVYRKGFNDSINYTINYSGLDSVTSLFTSNRSLTTNLGSGLYNVSITSPSYYGCYYNNLVLNDTLSLSVCELSSIRSNIFFRDHVGNLVPNVWANVVSGNSSVYFNVSQGNLSIYENSLSTNVFFNYSSFFGVYNFTPSVDGENITIFLFNSLNITIRNELSNALITQFTSVRLTNTNLALEYLYNTSSGNIFISNITNGDYLITFSSQNYSSRVYSRTLSSFGDSFTAYLTFGRSVSFCFYNPNSAVLSGVNLVMQRIINSAWTPVQNDYSDINGRINYVFANDSDYLFNYSKSGYRSGSFTLSPPRNDVLLADGCNYDFVLVFSSSTINYPSLNVSGSASYSNLTKILSFYYISTDSSFNNYSYYVSRIASNASEYFICSSSSASLTNTFTCDLTGYQGTIYVQAKANNQIFYGQYLIIPGLPKLFDNLNSKDSAYISGFILAIIIFGGIAFGLVGTLVSGVAGILVIVWLGLLSPVNIVLVSVCVVVSIIISLGLRRN